MPGSPVTDQQARLFMTLNKSLPMAMSIPGTGFSRSTGTRLKTDPERTARPKAQRARRRSDPLAAIFESDVVPILEASNDIRPVSVLR